MPSARERAHDSKLPLIRAAQQSGAIHADAPPALILMAVMALATAWSPVLPFGAIANPGAGLPPDIIRDAIADMVARIAAPTDAPPFSGQAQGHLRRDVGLWCLVPRRGGLIVTEDPGRRGETD